MFLPFGTNFTIAVDLNNGLKQVVLIDGKPVLNGERIFPQYTWFSIPAYITVDTFWGFMTLESMVQPTTPV